MHCNKFSVDGILDIDIDDIYNKCKSRCFRFVDSFQDIYHFDYVTTKLSILLHLDEQTEPVKRLLNEIKQYYPQVQKRRFREQLFQHLSIGQFYDGDDRSYNIYLDKAEIDDIIQVIESPELDGCFFIMEHAVFSAIFYDFELRLKKMTSDNADVQSILETIHRIYRREILENDQADPLKKALWKSQIDLLYKEIGVTPENESSAPQAK